MLRRLRARQEWQFFAVLPRADPALATVWWALLILNGAMPAVFAVAIGATVDAVQQARPVGGTLAVTGLVFVLMLILSPIQTAVSMNLGNKVSRLAQRDADSRLRAATRHRTSGGSGPR